MKIVVDNMPDIGNHCVFYKDDICLLGDETADLPKCWNYVEHDATSVHLCPYLIDINSLEVTNNANNT